MSAQDDLYLNAMASYGSALERLARAYETNIEDRRDLAQDIHLAIWQSFAIYDARCSVRTWVYRIAHNVAISRAMKRRQFLSHLVSLEDMDALPGPITENSVDRQSTLDHISRLIQQLRPTDRQIIVCYLEDMDAASIAEITGLSPQNVSTRVHRIKTLLATRYQTGGSNDGPA